MVQQFTRFQIQVLRTLLIFHLVFYQRYFYLVRNLRQQELVPLLFSTEICELFSQNLDLLKREVEQIATQQFRLFVLLKLNEFGHFIAQST